MATTTDPMTLVPRRSAVDDYILQAPPEVLSHFERVGGLWRTRDVAGRDHQRTSRRLANEFERRGYDAEEGMRVILPDREPVAPDVLIVSKTNPNPLGPTSYFGAPDLVVEVVEVLAADNDHGEDVVKKAMYAANGVRYYWLVRLKTGQVERWALTVGAYGFLGTSPLEPVDQLPLPADL
jgi:Uma2 family endonuclease